MFSKAWPLKLFVEAETVETAYELVSYSHCNKCVFNWVVYFCHDTMYDIVSESINWLDSNHKC